MRSRSQSPKNLSALPLIIFAETSPGTPYVWKFSKASRGAAVSWKGYREPKAAQALNSS